MKKIKGFSLIECIVALAILGIASLTMAEIYANISRINRNNHMVNTSLSYQMKEVETKTETSAVKIPSGETVFDGDPPHMRPGDNVNYFYIENTATNEIYSFPVDCYVLLSRDQNNEPSMLYNDVTDTWYDNPAYEGKEDNEISLRYKYMQSATN